MENRTLPGPGDGRIGNVVFETDVSANHRIRISLAWNSCPTGKVGNAPTTVITDYDIFLLETSPTPRYWYSSQSVDDSVEGFDEEVPETGHYQVWLGSPKGAPGCSALGSAGLSRIVGPPLGGRESDLENHRCSGRRVGLVLRRRGDEAAAASTGLRHVRRPGDGVRDECHVQDESRSPSAPSLRDTEPLRVWRRRALANDPTRPERWVPARPAVRCIQRRLVLG